jgi:hypothetical protein
MRKADDDDDDDDDDDAAAAAAGIDINKRISGCEVPCQ